MYAPAAQLVMYFNNLQESKDHPRSRPAVFWVAMFAG